MPLQIERAQEADVPALFELRCRVADAQTHAHGEGPWSGVGTDRGVRRAVLGSHVVIGRIDGQLIAALSLQTKKPWAIDLAYFTPSKHALYLVDMRVDPDWQGRGLGRELVEAAGQVADQAGARVIRLDAFDAPAGAGPFYRKCGFTEMGRKAYRGVPLIYFERVVSLAPDTLST